MTWRNRADGLALALGALGLLLGTPAAASDDANLESRIETRLSAADFHQPANVQVEVQDGKAVLSGFVPTVHDLWTAERAARKVTKRVQDDVTVRPTNAVSDVDLGKAIERAVIRYPYYGVFDAVGFTINDGNVVLSGSVAQPYHKSDIEDRISRIVGIRALASTVEVQPLSPFDQRLRMQCYRAIYGSSVFSRLAVNPNPPVRILVTNGHVALEGVVDSTSDKHLLTILASQVPGFGPVRNDVQVGTTAAKTATRGAYLVV
jgi:hyperosmotically inducible protein